MKKLLIVFVLSLSMLACSSDGDENPAVEGNLNASYELKFGGALISSNSSIPLGMVLDATGAARLISVTERDNVFMMMMTQIPMNAGETIQLNNDDDVLIALTGSKVADYSENQEAIVIDQGSMTRDANNPGSRKGVFKFILE